MDVSGNEAGGGGEQESESENIQVDLEEEEEVLMMDEALFPAGMKFMPVDEDLFFTFLMGKINRRDFVDSKYIINMDKNPFEIGFFQPERIYDHCFATMEVEQRYFYLHCGLMQGALLSGSKGQWMEQRDSLYTITKEGGKVEGVRKTYEFFERENGSFALFPTDWRLYEYQLISLPDRVPLSSENWFLYKLNMGQASASNSTDFEWRNASSEDNDGGSGSAASTSMSLGSSSHTSASDSGVAESGPTSRSPGDDEAATSKRNDDPTEQ